MPNGLKKRQQEILIAMERLARKSSDGSVTVRQIAAAVDLDVNGVSQSLSAPSMVEYVEDMREGKAGDRKVRLKKTLPNSPRLFQG